MPTERCGDTGQCVDPVFRTTRSEWTQPIERQDIGAIPGDFDGRWATGAAGGWSR
jgi:hypothetical protein